MRNSTNNKENIALVDDKPSTDINKLWQRLDENDRAIVLYFVYANPPVSVDTLSSLSGASAVQVLNVMDKLKRKGIVVEKKGFGRGIYFLQDVNLAGFVQEQIVFSNMQEVTGKIIDYCARSLPDGEQKTLVLASKPDAILVGISTPVTFGFVTKSARELGFKGPVFSPTHLDIDFTSMIAGGATDIFGMGITLKDQAGLSNEAKYVSAEFLKKYPPKDLISDVHLVGYNGLWVLLQTIEKAQSVDPKVVEKTYEGLTKKGDLQTLWGPAYTCGQKTLGVNKALCYPYTLDSNKKGVSKNEKTVYFNTP